MKEALQAEVGLPVDRNIPLIGFIGRLEEQKGSDILSAAIPKFINENVQIIVLVSDEINKLMILHCTDTFTLKLIINGSMSSGNWEEGHGDRT